LLLNDSRSPRACAQLSEPRAARFVKRSVAKPNQGCNHGRIDDTKALRDRRAADYERATNEQLLTTIANGTSPPAHDKR